MVYQLNQHQEDNSVKSIDQMAKILQIVSQP